MNDSITTIPLANLALAFIPVIFVFVILYRWSLAYGNAIYAVVRMLVQLLLMGYLLAYIFEVDNQWVVVAILFMMVLISCWIALQTVNRSRCFELYKYAVYAVALGGGSVLFMMTVAVLNIDPWYHASQMVPLAGMVFANTMNSVALAVERMESEVGRGVDYAEARVIALRTAMIPVINSLFAVGLVSIPGMMTGQILSGVSPLIAVRYQVMVMCMVFASAGISTALFLVLAKGSYNKK
ncbi:Probable iron export permease protein FetB [hydrothermal vent metagenome]|uniref:Probable iron export permease protein FetB n=1 Tax=hydrothermal vent metagenome TaxID=652676 RepID=A0A3B0Z9E5_9ZZZZ